MRARAAQPLHLTGLGRLDVAGLALYAATLALQLPLALLRGAVAQRLCWLLLSILGQPTAPAHTLFLIAAYGPLVCSLATLVLPEAGWLWMQENGGRAPSRRERLLYKDALATLAQADPRVRPPRRWFVLDTPRPGASVYADTLMLTRGLLDSACLEPVLAHELGHLNGTDARLTAALHRLTTPPRKRLGFPLRTLGYLASGAPVIWITRLPWSAYWQAREHAADAYAARLGQGLALARYLDHNTLDDLPAPFPWLASDTQPPAEHRIERLQATVAHA